jgi:hypothetical protein
MGCDYGPELRIFEQCPASMSNLLLVDTMKITTPRVIVA